MEHSYLWWALFNAFILLMLAVDLFVFNRKAHEIKVREALFWTCVWIALALLFNFGVYLFRGREAALQFLAGYLIEKSLSVDNLFVFLLIFSCFCVSKMYQHKILFWGILGALIFRAIFIILGVKLLAHFHWLMYVMGAFLVFTGVKLGFEKDKEIHPERNIVLRIFKKFIPITHENEGGKFFVRQAGRLMATPFFVVLLIIESTDIIFAVDSIPAIFSITLDPFIVYTSNVFAILGLRALYFALAGMMELFHHLHYGLSVILIFVGVKMLIAEYYKIPIGYALLFIVMVLVISVIASWKWPRKVKIGS